MAASRRRGLLRNPVVTALGPILVVGVLAALAIVSSRSTPGPSCTAPGAGTVGRRTFGAPPCRVTSDDKIYLATLETSLGTVRMVLEPRLAPKSVNNFVFLARQRFYDNTLFYEVFHDKGIAVIVGGDPNNDGTGGPGYRYGGETPSPITRYVPGIVGMWAQGGPQNNGSQFFIVGDNSPELPITLTVFGRVLPESMPVVLEILEVDGQILNNGAVAPDPPVRLQRVTIEERSRA